MWHYHAALFVYTLYSDCGDAGGATSLNGITLNGSQGDPTGEGRTLKAAMTGSLGINGLHAHLMRPLIFSFSTPAYATCKHEVIMQITRVISPSMTCSFFGLVRSASSGNYNIWQGMAAVGVQTSR